MSVYVLGLRKQREKKVWECNCKVVITKVQTQYAT